MAEEKQKTSAAEAKVAKLQAKNKSLNDENTKLRQILQQIQVSAASQGESSSGQPSVQRTAGGGGGDGGEGSGRQASGIGDSRCRCRSPRRPVSVWSPRLSWKRADRCQ